MILLYNNGSSYHKDLTLVLKEGITKTADSYVFVIDLNIDSDDESELEMNEVATMISKLLEWWLDKVKSLKNEEVAYLPFDYSDEYIGVIKVHKIYEILFRLSYGITTKYNAWTIENAESPINFILDENDLIVTSEELDYTEDEIVNGINESIVKIRSKANI